LEILKTAKATLMLKEETARFDRTRCLALALANAKSQSHVQRRALKSRLLAELD
jgi:hypothetical protein